MRVRRGPEVGKPQVQVEELVVERHGEPPNGANRETRDSTPTSQEPPQATTTTGVKVGTSEPLDGLDPNPRGDA